MQQAFNDSIGILSDVTTPQPPSAQGFRDSLGILTGQARTDSLGDLQSVTPIEEKKDFSPGTTGYRDSLGILGAPTARKLDVQDIKREKSQFKDSLGILSGSPDNAQIPSGPRQSIDEPFPAMPTAPGVPMPEQIGARTSAVIERVDRLIAQRQAEGEIQRRKTALIQEDYRRNQEAMGVQTEAPPREPSGDFAGALLSEQPPPRTEFEREIGGVESNPWTDPSQVAAAGFGAGTKFAISRGAKVLPAIGRGIAAALPGMATEYPIGATVDALAENNPELAFLAAIGLGLTSGLTVERLAERGLLKLTKNIASKYPDKAKVLLPDEVIARFKTRPTAGTEAPSEIDVAAERIERRRAAARQTPVEPEVPYSRSGGTAEDLLVTPTTQEKGYSDSLHILNPPKESRVVWGSEDLESMRGLAWVAKKQAEEARGKAAVKTDSFRTWVAKTGGLNPEDPTFGGEVRDITRGATRGQGYPLGFLNKKAPSLDIRVEHAKEAGWLRADADENDFLNAVERDSKKRLVDIGVEDELLSQEAARSKRQSDWIVPPARMEKGEAIVQVDVRALNDSWKKNKTLYVGEGGEGEIAGRLKGVQSHIASGKTIESPIVHVNQYGEVTFVDGRHRFATLRNMGERTVPVVMDTQSRKHAEKAGLLEKDEILWTHPSTITGPLGGIAAGVDWDKFQETGEISFDPKRALYGALAGAAGGAAIPKARSLARSIAHTWEEKIAEPFLNAAKDTVNGWLGPYENLRRGLGMGRSQVFKDMMRDYRRDVEHLWGTASELGKDLQNVAPTKVEQKRLMQIIKGSLSANPELTAKANKVRVLFDEMREELKDHNLLEYSRFDKLTRAERATIRKTLNGPDPATMKNPELIEYAKTLGVQPNKGAFNRDYLIKNIQSHLEFQRGRLNDFYHSASAGEYAPIFYNKVEGLTPEQTKVLQEEINHLKIKSRRGNPEGKQDLEALISKLEGMLGEGKEARKQQRITHQALVKSYAHQRLDLPAEVQRVMGLIEEAPYPVAKGLGIQETDLRKARLFEDIDKTPGFTIRPRKGVDIPSNYHLVEDERFGVLNGQYVRKDIWNDLREVEEWRGEFVRNWDKYLGWWKYGKVILNPSTHMRNAYSNMILAYLGDVNPGDVVTYGKAAKALKQGEANPFFKEFKDWGGMNQTFYSAEIGKLRDELASVRDPGTLKNWFRTAMSIPSNLYEGNEKFFKLAVFIKARESGLDVDKAARKAEKFLFNYGDIPPIVKQAKRWLIPFATFTYKAVPLFAEMAIKKPWKVGAITAAIYGMEEFSKKQLGLSDEAAEKERKMLPDWQQRRLPPYIGPKWLAPYTQVLMPFQDKWGSNLYLDLSYILPYGNVAEKWGQSALPLSDVLPSNPLFQFSAAILTNKDAFTGRPIYNEILDSAAQIAGKYLSYAWRELAPSMAPGGYSWNKIRTGLMNTLSDDKKVLDWAGRPIELQTALLSSLLGIKLSPASTQELRKFQHTEMDRISRSVSDEIGKLKRDRERNKITPDEFKDEIRQLMDLKKKLILEKR